MARPRSADHHCGAVLTQVDLRRAARHLVIGAGSPLCLEILLEFLRSVSAETRRDPRGDARSAIRARFQDITEARHQGVLRALPDCPAWLTEC